LLGTQVCSDPTPMHCSIALGKNAFPTAQGCSARQAGSKLVTLQIHL